jgi:hypothetical protein
MREKVAGLILETIVIAVFVVGTVVNHIPFLKKRILKRITKMNYLKVDK